MLNWYLRIAFDRYMIIELPLGAKPSEKKMTQVSVSRRRRKFRRSRTFMGIARDGGDTRDEEVKRQSGVASLLQERNEERSQAAINVCKQNGSSVSERLCAGRRGRLTKSQVVLEGQVGQSRDIIDGTVGEVGGGSDEEDCVLVDESGDLLDVDLAGDLVDGDVVNLDAEEVAGLVERSMSRNGNNPSEEKRYKLHGCGGSEASLTSRAP